MITDQVKKSTGNREGLRKAETDSEIIRDLNTGNHKANRSSCCSFFFPHQMSSLGFPTEKLKSLNRRLKKERNRDQMRRQSIIESQLPVDGLEGNGSNSMGWKSISHDACLLSIYR